MQQDAIQLGSVVQLRSGGPNMTVASIDGNEAKCLWFPTTVRRVVFADNVPDEKIDDLRAEVERALADPDYVVVTNFQVVWQEVGAPCELVRQSFPLDTLRLAPAGSLASSPDPGQDLPG